MPFLSRDDIQSLLMGGVGVLCLALLLLAGYLSYRMGDKDNTAAPPQPLTQEQIDKGLESLRTKGGPPISEAQIQLGLKSLQAR